MAESNFKFCPPCYHGILLRACSETVQGSNCCLWPSSSANTKRCSGMADSESADVRKDRAYTLRRTRSSQDRTSSPRYPCAQPLGSRRVRRCCPQSRESTDLCSEARNRQGVWRSAGLPRCVLRNVSSRGYDKLMCLAELLDDPNVDAVYNPVRKFVARGLRRSTHLP